MWYYGQNLQSESNQVDCELTSEFDISGSNKDKSCSSCQRHLWRRFDSCDHVYEDQLGFIRPTLSLLVWIILYICNLVIRSLKKFFNKKQSVCKVIYKNNTLLQFWPIYKRVVLYNTKIEITKNRNDKRRQAGYSTDKHCCTRCIKCTSALRFPEPLSSE